MPMRKPFFQDRDDGIASDTATLGQRHWNSKAIPRADPIDVARFDNTRRSLGSFYCSGIVRALSKS